MSKLKTIKDSHPARVPPAREKVDRDAVCREIVAAMQCASPVSHLGLWTAGALNLACGSAPETHDISLGLERLKKYGVIQDAGKVLWKRAHRPAVRLSDQWELVCRDLRIEDPKKDYLPRRETLRRQDLVDKDLMSSSGNGFPWRNFILRAWEVHGAQPMTRDEVHAALLAYAEKEALVLPSLGRHVLSQHLHTLSKSGVLNRQQGDGPVLYTLAPRTTDMVDAIMVVQEDKPVAPGGHGQACTRQGCTRQDFLAASYQDTFSSLRRDMDNGVALSVLAADHEADLNHVISA